MTLKYTHKVIVITAFRKAIYHFLLVACYYRVLSSTVFIARLCAKRGICRHRVSVCVCVCVSVTLPYCIKTAKHRITQITPHDSPLTLVVWHQSARRNWNGITPYGGDKCRLGGSKFVTFDGRKTRYNSKTVQDRHI